MARKSLLNFVLASFLIIAGCATTPPINPFKIAEEDFRRDIKTIALAPVAIPADIEDADPVKARFEALIQAKLREAGFTVVPSTAAAEIFNSMNKQLGGIFDPLTGKRDEAKAKVAREHARRELGAKFKADAVLFPYIRPGPASFNSGSAKWAGTSESVSLTGGFLGAMQVNQLRGNINALSLIVAIENISRVDAYSDVGGIQLAAKISGGRFVPVPRNALFSDEERMEASVNFALARLAKIPAAGGENKPKP